MNAINERLARLPDVEQSAQMMAQAVTAGITEALQADANTKLAHELGDLWQEAGKRRGLFGRLFGGG